MKIPDDVRLVLEQAECAGALLRITRRLSPALYSKVDTVLEAAGARWDPRLQAHAFPPGQPGAAALVRRVLDAGEVTTEAERRKASQWYPTPHEQAVRLMILSQSAPGDIVLEPSAGDGAIARVLAANGAVVDCVELDPGRAAAIRSAGCARAVTAADFLALPAPARPEYDRVVMNPPFADGAAEQHVLHALRFIRPGGRLAALLPDSIRWRQARDAKEIRRLARDRGGLWENVPDGAFAASGVHPKTVMLVIPVPGGPAWTGAGTAPVRATIIDGAQGVHFDLAATPAGAYVYYDPWTGHDRVFRQTEPCAGCGSPTWAHDDGNNDTRGIFGPRTYTPVGADEFPLPAERKDGWIPVSRCGGCWDDRQRNDRALAAALTLNGPAPAPGAEAAPRRAARNARRARPPGALTLF